MGECTWMKYWYCRENKADGECLDGEYIYYCCKNYHDGECYDFDGEKDKDHCFIDKDGEWVCKDVQECTWMKYWYCRENKADGECLDGEYIYYCCKNYHDGECYDFDGEKDK